MARQWKLLNRRRALFAAVALASSGFTLWFVIVFLAPSRAPRPRVTYQEFTTDLEAGRIEAITIHDQLYTFRSRNGQSKETIGPELSVAKVRALRPSNSELMPPKIEFEP